ncbi:rhomboid-like protein [Streptomyces sp. NPDC090798]|uniref:rhomboid-like protein n=1 Tax=Streptomyces sp. NPDC090798 TaxID=3365968 RepID=UPI0038139D40
MNRSTTATATAVATTTAPTAPSADAARKDPQTGTVLLVGVPRQRGATAVPPAPRPATTPSVLAPPAPSAPPVSRALARLRTLRPWRLLPTPTGTPFTFGYAAVLTVTAMVTDYADPSLVHALQQGSSTDVAHLIREPVLVLLASALWMAGGIASPYAIGFVLVLTALERRIGGLRAAGVFLLGHVVATLATEVPVGLSVLAGDLPDTSLHRLDYGISFGVATSVGALAGLLRPWLRWPLLVAFGSMVVGDLLEFADPMTDWGHLMSLAIGVSTWPLVRRWRRARTAAASSPGAPTAVPTAQTPDTGAGRPGRVAARRS